MAAAIVLGLLFSGIGQYELLAQPEKTEKLDLNSIQAVMLEPPPFREHTAKSQNKPKQVTLVKVSEKPNQITDEEYWFSSNSLTYPSYTPPNPFMGSKGDVPAFIPEKRKDRILTDCFYDDEYIYLVYGFNFGDCDMLYIVGKSDSKLLYAFDFTNYVIPPDFVQSDREFINMRVNWAKIEGGVLYVSHAHSTYAYSSKGMNAYITAIMLDSKEVIWRSKPLVCNSQNFLIEGDVIITGYGFTKEKDYIHLLDKYTGKVLKSIKIKSAASLFVKKGGRLYVRTYDTDYVFDIK